MRQWNTSSTERRINAGFGASRLANFPGSGNNPLGFAGEKIMRAVTLVALLFACSLQAETLTIDRIYAGGSLSGPTPSQLKISPDAARVTFLRAKADDQTT